MRNKMLFVTGLLIVIALGTYLFTMSDGENKSPEVADSSIVAESHSVETNSHIIIADSPGIQTDTPSTATDLQSDQAIFGARQQHAQYYSRIGFDFIHTAHSEKE